MKQKSLGLNAVLNGIKQCCSIIFPLITFPYISRVLGNDGYGKYSFSYSVTNYFILLAALEYILMRFGKEPKYEMIKKQ